MGKGEIYFTPPNKKAASASASASASPLWAELPVELTENILQRLGVVDILQSAQKVCAPWRKVCKDPSLWRVINMIHPINKYDDDCAVMFHHAVNRSHGELTDLTIAAIVDHKLLGYIADRSSHLRRLTLACCELSSGALSEAVKKLPELEELHIFIPVPSRCISSGDIETIGKSCPMLKSFTYNQPRCNHPSPEYYSEEEEEVSKTDYNAYLPKIEEKPEAASSNHDHLHHDCEVKEEQKEDEIEDEREKEKEDEKEEEREEETKKEKDEVIEEEKEEEREEEKEKENEEEIEEEKEEEMEEEKEEEPEADYNNYSPKLEEKPEAAYNNHDHLHHVYVEDDNEAEDDDDDDDDDEEQEDVEMEGYHEFYENSEFVGSVPYDSDDDNRYDINNEDAKAIARTMPNLQHLGLVANDLTEKGLKAILEGCPRLESLDLRMCYGVYLQGKVWRRCCEQIKDVKLPCDSIDEHPYAWKHRRRSPYMKRSEWFEYISTL